MTNNGNNTSGELVEIKQQVLAALSHPEADEGLYFRNLHNLHEEDERPIVNGTQVQILDALRELIDEGRVTMIDGEEAVFILKR